MARLSVRPFEAAVSGLLVITGIAGLGHIGILDPVFTLIPHWESVSINTLTLLSGLLMAIGVIAGWARAEVPGLFFLLAVIITRFIIIGVYEKFSSSFVTTGFFYILVVAAAVIRLRAIRKGDTIIRLPGGEL
jgi:hypothetical protein